MSEARELRARIGQVNNRLQKARAEAEAIEDPNVRRAVWSLAEAIEQLTSIVRELEATREPPPVAPTS